mmetsp:Transcript_19955/g.46003  ORF Transcript_19955/g.46003 Transcript_19955/m.46003 type:complete len:160 (+) Transcript_19955:64-543(+)
MHVACGQRIVVPLAFGSKFGRRTWLSAKVDKLDGLTAKVDKLTETVEGIKTKVNETGATLSQHTVKFEAVNAKIDGLKQEHTVKFEGVNVKIDGLKHEIIENVSKEQKADLKNINRVIGGVQALAIACGATLTVGFTFARMWPEEVKVFVFGPRPAPTG